MSVCTQLTLDQLLALRNSEPVAAESATHIAECVACSSRLRELHAQRAELQGLPAVAAPPLDLPRLKEQSIRSAAGRERRFALAASAAALALVTVIGFTLASDPAPHLAQIDLPNATDTATAHVAVEAVPMSALVARSQQLELALMELPGPAYVARGGTVATIDELQGRIEWLDYQLSMAEEVGLTELQSVQLWSDRVRLLDTLIKVRYPESQQVAML